MHNRICIISHNLLLLLLILLLLLLRVLLLLLLVPLLLLLVLFPRLLSLLRRLLYSGVLPIRSRDLIFRYVSKSPVAPRGAQRRGRPSGCPLC